MDMSSSASTTPTRPPSPPSPTAGSCRQTQPRSRGCSVRSRARTMRRSAPAARCATTRRPISDRLPIGWRPVAPVLASTKGSISVGLARSAIPLAVTPRLSGAETMSDVGRRPIWTATRSGVGSNGLDRPALQILADHDEFDLSPDDAVAAGMAPDRAWSSENRSPSAAGAQWTGRPYRLLRAGPWRYPRQLHGCPILAFATKRADRGPAGGHVDRCRADVADRHRAAACLLRRNPRRPSQSGC